MPFHRPIPNAKPYGKGRSFIRIWAQAEKLMQVALILPCSAFIGWLGGVWLDRLLHQSWIQLVGIVFGGISGLIYVIRMAIAASNDPLMQDEDEGEQKDKDKTGGSGTSL